ncbi:hypothetical protein A1Q1_06640 [Trichosporon asahii var. asahii CBS 2479]|uniref:Uncharacterized protein n=1 Tax=Trichosporon asahii var. asahii (strain ATCC 90039 / CBS 2479 / JCM 2466 / KCTC 7840 / NBRC 103889/ NCYC 2677 / UAMH 7654) TaxID=1186058 RepID=J6FA53_TRIAS|nr:hypothetical protein A1Q1_06640 [Trichosporon asahii var. asahii CBS 2479]EJT52102.1 hypothetical protein A1Q1_06640 [Trichosporon asahii var. asahii CBS 2479]
MIIRHLAARTGAIRSSLASLHPSSRQSSRHLASASVALASPEVDDRPTQHESGDVVRAPRLKMPAGHDPPPVDVRRSAAASSSSSSSSSVPESSRRSRSARASTSKPSGRSRRQSEAPPVSAPLKERKTFTRDSPPHLPSSQPPGRPATPLSPEELRRQQEERATQFMESALSIPVPDPKLYLRQLVSHLESDSSLLSPSSIAALEMYALRLNETQFAERVRALGFRERLQLPPRQKIGRYRNAKVSTNMWMTKKYPPLPLLPESEDKITANTFLRYQHYLLINSEGHSLRTTISTLESLKAAPTEKLAALHLALCYAKEPHALLDEAEAIGVTSFRRQTAHCSVIALLQRRTKTEDVQRLMRRFKGVPSPETFRLVALHALKNKDEELAKYAWEEGRTSLAHERRIASAPVTPRRLPRTRGQATGAVPRVTPFFRHLGRHLTRWERVMHCMKDRGWAHRAQFDPAQVPKGLPTLAARWFWGPDPNPPSEQDSD